MLSLSQWQLNCQLQYPGRQPLLRLSLSQAGNLSKVSGFGRA
jgi:hypothetical protein